MALSQGRAAGEGGGEDGRGSNSPPRHRPLPLLAAIAWAGRAEDAFFASGCRELPRIDRDWYLRRPLGFDPVRKRGELAALELDVSRSLGEGHAAGRLLLRRCRQY